jgi:trans-2,3-dihydro-3-hydroxyanthranilate isomerase
MTHAYEIVDVFSDAPLQGNPVAVFTDARGLDPALMQPLARELNLSETVFVLGRENGAADIRIFTPGTELPFAGHPVLGTAFVLAREQATDTVTLRTGAGPVRVMLRGERGQPVYGEMEQPLPIPEPFEPVDALLQAVGAAAPVLPVQAYRNGPLHVYVALSGDHEVAALSPDFGALRRLGEFGVSCFCATDGEVKTRMFGPGVGVAEDPATGSAAGPLAVHLARHGRIAYGQRIRIRQGTEIGRPSVLYAQVEGSAERLERVAVGGAAVHVGHGEFNLPAAA